MERFATKQKVCDSVVVHQHGIWTGISRVTNIMRKVRGVATVVAPHGSLEKWALARSRWKKRIALSLYEKSNLKNASCLYACSNQEVGSFRDFGLKNPVAVIPNGISHSWIESSGDSNAFRLKFNLPPEKQLILFLSRITPIKGLPLLMDALDVVRENLKNWLLVVAGSDEFNHKTEVTNKIRELGLERYVRFVGLLLGQEKRDAFSAAEFFVLPTKREAAPVVVLEALGAAVPVLTTKGAPWENLAKHQCGWWTEISVEGLAEALSDALRSSPDRLRSMGVRGKELVLNKYTWSKSALMTVELYDWLLGRREKPDFVIVD
jgi:glycosyltransferase involved in cell wall biosynthesis